ncbi:MAG: undecaprenyl-diphosphate phosphatase [Firmicutes bacterium]|nr:undecaprenyl-diphosphate phosphatase [Bacillota bacterium]
MPIYVAIILGLIQGLTEFLPVSSSGHLILAQYLFNLPEDMLLFNIILHVATLLAVLIVFRLRIWQLVRHPFNKTNLALVLATIVTVSLVLIFKDIIDRTFTARVLPITFFITAIILFATTFVRENPNQNTDDAELEITKKSALATGLAQAIAVVPGFSRSGFTIATALATGTKRQAAAEFSFLMSIPIIIGALVLELVSGPVSSDIEIFPLVIAFLVALVSGVFAIKFMLRIVRRIKLYWFSLYLVILAIVTVFVI